MTVQSTWGEQPFARRDALLMVRNVGIAAGGIILADGLAELAEAEVSARVLRGPRVTAEQWVSVERRDAHAMPWMRFTGNSGWMGWLRLTDETYDVGVMTVDAESMHAHAAELPPTARHAVAWLRGREWFEVGVLPDSVDAPGKAFPDRYAIGMGVKRGDLQATMGLWVPEDNAFVVPEGVQAQPMVRTYDMAQMYPGVRWV